MARRDPVPPGKAVVRDLDRGQPAEGTVTIPGRCSRWGQAQTRAPGEVRVGGAADELGLSRGAGLLVCPAPIDSRQDLAISGHR